MLIYDYIDLANFPFWGQAKNNAGSLTERELEIIENIFSDLYPDGMGKVEVNDWFAYEFDTILEWLGR